MCFSKIENCYFNINELMRSGMSQEDAWNENSIKLVKATEVNKNMITVLLYRYIFFFKYIYI